MIFKHSFVHFFPIISVLCVMAADSCILLVCKGTGTIRTVEIKAIEKLIEQATERGDDVVQLSLQVVVDNQKDNALIDVHTVVTALILQDFM